MPVLQPLSYHQHQPISHNPRRTGERSYVPGDVVAPADGLHPVDGAGVEPHQVSWTLDKPVDGHVGLVQVLQVGPPRAHQEVDVVPGGAGGEGERVVMDVGTEGRG